MDDDGVLFAGLVQVKAAASPTPIEPVVLDTVRDALLVRLAFTKHKGRSLGEVLEREPGYIGYLGGIHIESKPLRDAVMVVRLAYRDRIDRAMEAEKCTRKMVWR